MKYSEKEAKSSTGGRCIACNCSASRALQCTEELFASPLSRAHRPRLLLCCRLCMLLSDLLFVPSVRLPPATSAAAATLTAIRAEATTGTGKGMCSATRCKPHECPLHRGQEAARKLHQTTAGLSHRCG